MSCAVQAASVAQALAFPTHAQEGPWEASAAWRLRRSAYR